MKLPWPLLILLIAGCGPAPEVRVGSKQQTESVILGEMVALLARSAGAHVDHQSGRELGGTQLLWKALLSGDIDVYPEYTGTISEEILAGKGLREPEAIRRALAEYGIQMSRPLGFNDNYALGMKKDVAVRLGISKISDLRSHPELRFGFSIEFLDRPDGWQGLRRRYDLPQQDLRGLKHELAYQGLMNSTIDVTDLYTTDPKILLYDLQVLTDDRAHFPTYQAVLLYRRDLPQRQSAAVAAFLQLEGRISETAMIDMNAQAEAEVNKKPEGAIAADFLAQNLNLHVQPQIEGLSESLLRLTWQHLVLVALSLTAAIIMAVPLGILAARWPAMGQAILGASGLIQTIPSIALLSFMIPLLGIGTKPAIMALFLYSLLPIVQNTYAGLHNIPGHIRESAEALGLPAGARLRLVELPMAARTILAGIKTAAVINVGTATLGGFIGAGGYGQVIFRGIIKYDRGLILEGAIPAALLALAVQGLFELAERWLVPKGLRLKAE